MSRLYKKQKKLYAFLPTNSYHLHLGFHVQGFNRLDAIGVVLGIACSIPECRLQWCVISNLHLLSYTLVLTFQPFRYGERVDL